MSDVESVIREGFRSLDPLPPGAEGDWRDVVGRARRPRRRRRLGYAVAAGTAVAAAAIAAVALLPAGSGGPSTAAAALNRLADRIAAQSLTPKPGQYLYIESKSEYGAIEEAPTGSCDIRSTQHDQIWISPDGSGLDRDAFGPGHFTSASDRAACLRLARTQRQKQALRRQLAARTGDAWNAPGCLSLKPMNRIDYAGLSTDPQVFLKQIDRLFQITSAPSPEYEASQEFSTLASFLHDTDVPATVRATLYRALALIPGVRLLGTVRDHDGRPGLGVAYTSNGRGTIPSGQHMPKYWYKLVFAPQTGELLGEQQTGPGSGWTVYLNEKVVDNLPRKPPVPLGPPCKPGADAISHPIPGGSVTNGAPLKSK